MSNKDNRVMTPLVSPGVKPRYGMRNAKDFLTHNEDNENKGKLSIGLNTTKALDSTDDKKNGDHSYAHKNTTRLVSQSDDDNRFSYTCTNIKQQIIVK